VFSDDRCVQLLPALPLLLRVHSWRVAAPGVHALRFRAPLHPGGRVCHAAPVPSRSGRGTQCRQVTAAVLRIRIRIHFGQWIRIRIGNTDPDPDPGGSKLPIPSRSGRGTQCRQVPVVLRIRISTDPHSFWSAGSGSAVGIRIRIL
jgi:hypothetical protein